MAITFAKLGDADSACFYINKCIPYLDYFFPKRDQLVLNFGEIQEKTDDEYLNEAYRRRNKQIGYRLSSEYREVV